MPSSAPAKGFLGGIQGLHTVQFAEGKHSGLVLLRAALKEVGLRGLEREATYALETQQTAFAPWPERYFRRLMFEWPAGYGLYYGRPLRLLLGLIPCFAVLYALALHPRGHAGIWAIWLPDRVHKRPGEEAPVRVTHVPPLPSPWPTGRPWQVVGRVARSVLIGLYFSLLSAFHIGWRELNVGNWITRLQPREYTLRATGWVRVVSGLQSLISVYLLALWALTYFGRPFE